ncbi:HU family DNA-binding protein [Candidatus Persebacteraceae bacterium Df01]|jgi:DNA-binding protein HU-beta|uniref:HU family DNA-binding protein n=1 Tax=Candidatus Doriopsillibacter californiensis TaxID=2970740 RepID=A0ABT7QMC0_9GAMM|nr:HU family DNA-binding protein [Candidatus Persebacteraceae bacterium Df01]
MNKSEIIEKIATDAGLSKADAGRALSAFIDLISTSLRKKKPVAIVGFGTFDVQKRKARKGRNPQTGEELKIKASIAPRFRPGKTLKDTVNK